MAHSREALAHLGLHPAWGQLRELAEERQKQETTRLAAALLRGDTVSPEDIAFTRGFLKGMQFLLSNPTLEARKFQAEIEESASG
jgi:hypothetical protein